MPVNSFLRKRIALMVLLSFFSLVGLHAWPAADQNKMLPRQSGAAKAAAAGPGFPEKEGPPTAQKTKSNQLTRGEYHDFKSN